MSNSRNGATIEIGPDGTTRGVSPGGILPSSGLAVLTEDGYDTLFAADLWTLQGFDTAAGVETRAVHSIFAAPPREPEDPPYTFNRSGIATMDAALTVAADGDRLILSSWFGGAVQVYDPAAEAMIETFHDLQVPLNAIRFQGDLIVAELASHSVVRLSGDGGAPVTLAADLPIPTGLAATADDLWVAEWTTGRVFQVISGGGLLPEPREIAAGLQQPEGMGVAPAGGLLVVESGAGRLVRIDPESGAVTTLAKNLGTGVPGLPGFPPTHLFSGVAVGGDGTIYVSCDRAKEIVRLTPR